MDYEKMERTMEFILDQMANMTIKQAKIDEQLAILSADAVTADQEWDRLRDEIREVKEVAIAHNQAINQLLNSQREMREQHHVAWQESMKLHEQHQTEMKENLKLHEQHRVTSAENAAMIKEVGQRIDDLRKIVEAQTRTNHNGEGHQ